MESKRERNGNSTGVLLTMTASAVVYLAPWGAETGALLAGLWTLLLAFWALDRHQVAPYVYQAALAVLLIYPGLQAF